MGNYSKRGNIAPVDAAEIGIDPSKIGGEIEVADTALDIAEGIDTNLLPDPITPAEIGLLPDLITPADSVL